MQKLSLTSLIVIDGVSYMLPNANKLVMERMMNGIYGGIQLRSQMEAEINSIYGIQLKETLGSEKLINLSNIQYSYNDIKVNVAH